MAMSNHPENCPHCNVSLLDVAIPEKYLGDYQAGTTHYKREIGMEYPEKYDGVWFFRCPDCNGEWGGMREYVLR
jgi:uncharacterized protein with PIN domain